MNIGALYLIFGTVISLGVGFSASNFASGSLQTYLAKLSTKYPTLRTIAVILTHLVVFFVVTFALMAFWLLAPFAFRIQ